MRILGLFCFFLAYGFADYLSVSGFYWVCMIFFAVVGGVLLFGDYHERQNTSSYQPPQNEPFDPSKGCLVFHPETGEELRLWQGRYYRREKGRWIEVPPPR